MSAGTDPGTDPVTDAAAAADPAGAAATATVGSAAAGTAARRAQREAQQRAPRSAGRTPAGTVAGASASAPSRRLLDPDALAALEEERDFLLRSLDDLEREHDAGDVDDHDYESLKDDYTARAATVLRAIETRTTARAEARPGRSRRRGVLVGAAVLAGAIGLGIFVAQSSGTRGVNDAVSGNIRQTTRDRLLEAQSLFGQGKLVDAIKVYDQVLATEPDNTEALTYKGWLLYRTSTQTEVAADAQVLQAKALVLLDQALSVKPDYGDARVFRAIVRRDLGQSAAALEDLRQLPEGSVPVMMTSMVDQLRSELEAAVGSPTGTAPGAAAAPGTTRPAG